MFHEFNITKNPYVTLFYSNDYELTRELLFLVILFKNSFFF